MPSAAYKNRSIMTAWLLSYMTILLIPIVISGLMYYQTQQLFRSEINKSNSYLLNIFKQNMDNLWINVEKLSMEIAMDASIQNILNLHREPEVNDRYLILKASDVLKRYQAVNRGMDGFYIYLKNNDTLISPFFNTDQKTFLELYGEELGMGQKEFRQYFMDSSGGEFASITAKDGSNRKMVVYTLSLPVFQKGNDSANLVILMKAATFFSGANSMVSHNNSEIVILGGDNRVVASSSPEEPFDLDVLSGLLKKDGPMRYRSEEGSYVVSSSPSEVVEWRYVLAVPEKVFMEKADYIQRLVILGLALCLILGGFITRYSLAKNYNPLRAMIKSLESRLKYSFDKSNNEYGYIQQAISRIAEENEKMNSRLAQQSKALKSGFIASLMKGRERPVPVHELISNYDICLESEYFVVMAFYIEAYDSKVFQDMDSFAQYKIVQFIFMNVIEELVNQKNKGYLAEVDDLLVCLVNVRETEADHWRKEMARVAGEAQDFISTNYRIRFVTAVSNLHMLMGSIPEAYDEALKTMEYKKVMGMDNILFFDEICDSPRTEYYFPLEKEYQLMNCVKSGDFDHAKSLLEEVFQLNFEHGRLSVEIARCLMFDLVSTMIKTINEIGSIYQNSFVEQMNPVGPLVDCKTVNQMKKQIMTTLAEVCRYIASVKKNTDTKISGRVTEFIDANYRDVNLGISTIADYIGLNPAYVSKLFKEQYGKGILDYINEVRIRKAKERMRISGDNLESIARSVGYSNTKTFTRAFKNQEGTTPGRFKE